MGGAGSGRRSAKASIADCRTIDIGELCDGGSAGRAALGELHYRGERSGLLQGLLTYALAASPQEPLRPAMLLYCYWPSPTSAGGPGRLKLGGRPGRRYTLRCPGQSCFPATLRRLYCPPGSRAFLCRDCHDLVYPPSRTAFALTLAREHLAPVLAELDALEGKPRHRKAPSLDRADYEDLGPQEIRVACLRLRAAGLSCREIAALVGYGKSSVARFCQSGRAGIDLSALFGERLEHASWSVMRGAAALGDRALLAAMDHEAKRLRLYNGRGEGELRQCLKDSAPPLVVSDAEDIERCYESLRERGEQRLAAERGRRPKRATVLW